MKYALWIIQVLLAFAFIAAGTLKIITPFEEYVAMQPWAAAFSSAPWLITIIGILEVAGALGLILPAATRIMPILTPIAGAGLALTMVGAAILHLTRGEFGNLIPNIILMALAIFIAYGRYNLLPITSRQAATA
jgi:uncharacterized membrane protein YphA (DoxX/SURF4 family)